MPASPRRRYWRIARLQVNRILHVDMGSRRADASFAAVEQQERGRPVRQVALEFLDDNLRIGAAGLLGPVGVSGRDGVDHLAMRRQRGVRQVVAEMAGIEPQDALALI